MCIIIAVYRHIWTAIHTSFFDDLDAKGLQSSSYHNLTVALQKVWNNPTNPTSEKNVLKIPYTGLDTATMKNSGLGQNNTNTSTTAVSGTTISGTSTSGGGGSGEVQASSERVILLGRSIVNNDVSFTSTAVRSAYSESGNTLVNITTMPMISRITSDITSITHTDTEDNNHSNTNYSSLYSSISTGGTNQNGENFDLDSLMMTSSEDPSTQVSSQGDISISPTTIDLNRYIEPEVTYEISDRKKRVSGVFVSARDCHWTVVTSNVLLTKSGLYERMKVCSIRVYTVYVSKSIYIVISMCIYAVYMVYIILLMYILCIWEHSLIVILHHRCILFIRHNIC